MAPLKAFMRAQHHYYSECSTDDERRTCLMQALELMQGVCAAEPRNPLFVNRLAATLIKLGRRSSAIKVQYVQCVCECVCLSHVG